MNKAHKRIEELYRTELSGYSPEMRRALGRRLEVDARFRAIENYLEFLAYDDPRALPQEQDSSDAAGTGSAGSPEATSTDPPPAPLVGRPGASGEDWNGDHPPPAAGEAAACGCDESVSLREALRRSQAEVERLQRVEANHVALIAAIPRLYAVKSCPLSRDEMEIEFYNELIAGGESDERARHVAALAFP